MNSKALLVFPLVMLAAAAYAEPGEHLIPAGSLISCTISEPRLSSKTTAPGDPVLCQVSHSERYGRSVLPYRSYLVGRFEDYKDPGHFVGKGWMELRFDRMVIQPDTVIPIDARVVDVPGYRVDTAGRILGKGHATRDAVLWAIPVLWPVDLLMLPMRGPRPTLKEETRVTLKVMDDLAVPDTTAPTPDPYGLMHRQSGENVAPPAPQVQPQPQQMAQAAPEWSYAPAPAPPPVIYVPAMVAPPPPPPVIVVAQPMYAYGYYPGVVWRPAPVYAAPRVAAYARYQMAYRGMY